MKSVIHRHDTRGHANHGWLDTHHTFSFAGYQNPERMHFGVLRVLNDDVVAPGMGFSTHSHQNMEIISIPLEGDLKHRDSMGNVKVIRAGDVQVMSAGTGIQHSEFNANSDKEVRFLQIWLFPKERNVTPRYDQITVDASKLTNSLMQVVSPDPEDEGIWIHQDAWFYLGTFEKNFEIHYKMHDEKNGVYVFLLEGEVKIDDQTLERRDGLGLWELQEFKMEALQQSKVLVMEVPMG